MSAAIERAPYQRPTISASRAKCIGGEKGQPGCERKLAGQYLFGMKQASSTALEFGSALHTSAEHLQATGELLAPESDVGRVLASGAHLLKTCGDLLVEYEHVGFLPDGSRYVAFLDGHTERAKPELGTIVIQDLKTTSNPSFALVGPADTDDPADDYDLRKDIQCMLYAWILLCDVHWFCSPLPSDAHYGPKHWRLWVPAERHARVARLRWIYFLTKGVPRAWEENAFVLPSVAEAFMRDTILPLVAKINALHEWHYANPGVTLDEVDRTPAACGNRGRWCGVGERDACNFDKLGTPALDLVQLKVRKMTTPQERLAILQANNRAKAAGAAAAPVTAAPVQEAPAASPPAPAPTPTTAPESQPAPSAPPSAAVSSVPATTGSSAAAETAAAELTRGQKAAATRAANKAAAQAAPVTPPGPGINPPEGTEGVPAPAAPAAGTQCPSTDELLGLLNDLVDRVPVGVTITIEGQR